jgi:hypothetical protein
MKQLILFAALFAATSAQAQKVDTVKNAVQIKPIVINAIQKDTAYQVSWKGIDIVNDTSKSMTTYVQVFDRQAKKVGESNVIVPASVVRQWMSGGKEAVDDFILTFYGLSKR